MTEEGFKRKLTAILSADVEGYSRLMGEDEDATVRTLNTYREVISTLIQQHRGRVIDTTGDNLLAEFSSVVDALRCALDIQQEIKARNADLPENRRMEFRIGINLGDVIEEGDRLYGEGVNVAARVESLADGGGIAISGTAYDQVKNKLPLVYEYQGEQSVKNIAEPVRVYRVQMGPEPVAEVKAKKRPLLKRWQWAALAVIVIGMGALAIWNFFLRPAPPSFEPASIEKMAYSLPDKPSIAVLPFVNMSAEPEQEYFSDGITEEIITALAKVPDIFVIARNSTFTYKGKPVKIKQVSEELGVRYVLEGGVRKAGDRIRVTAQLIDATTGRHLWAERYDGRLGDVFDLQDKVTEKIIGALAVELTPDREENIADRGTKNVEAYDAFLQGRQHVYPQTRDNMAKALRYFKRAVELDPNFARAHAELAGAYGTIRAREYHKDLGISNARSLEQKHLELALKTPTASAHNAAAFANIWKGQIEEAMAHAGRSLALQPNYAFSCYTMGVALIYAGRSGEAIPYINRAMRLDPNYPALRLWWLGFAQFLNEQLEEAAITSERARKRNPHLAPWCQVAVYEYLGRKQEAEEVLAAYMKIRGWKKIPPIKVVMKWYQFKEQTDRARLAEGLRKAGLK